MEPMHVRFAALDDAPAICTIYNQGIDDRVATLETELRDAEERRYARDHGAAGRHCVPSGRGETMRLGGRVRLVEHDQQDITRPIGRQFSSRASRPAGSSG